MAQSERRSSKQRIHVRVVDLETGNEQVSGELTIIPGFCCVGCCCSTNWWPPRPNGPIPLPEAQQQ